MRKKVFIIIGLLLVSVFLAGMVRGAPVFVTDKMCYAWDDSPCGNAFGTKCIRNNCDLLKTDSQRVRGDCCGVIEELEPYTYGQDGYSRTARQYQTSFCYNKTLKTCCSAGEKTKLCEANEECAKSYIQKKNEDGQLKKTYTNVKCCNSESEQVCKSSIGTSSDVLTVTSECIPKERVCTFTEENYELNGEYYFGTKACEKNKTLNIKEGWDCNCENQIGSYQQGVCEINVGYSTMKDIVFNEDIVLHPAIKELVESDELGCVLGKPFNKTKYGYCGDYCIGTKRFTKAKECCCDTDGDGEKLELCKKHRCKKLMSNMFVEFMNETVELKITSHMNDNYLNLYEGKITINSIEYKISAMYSLPPEGKRVASDITVSYENPWYDPSAPWYKSQEKTIFLWFHHPCGYLKQNETYTVTNLGSTLVSLGVAEVTKQKIKIVDGPCCPDSISFEGVLDAEIDVRDDYTKKNGKPTSDVEFPRQKFFSEDNDIQITFEVNSASAEVCMNDDGTVSPEQKEKCAMPEWFEVDLKIRARYYDNDLAIIKGLLVKVQNIDELIEKVSEITGTIKANLAYLAELDGQNSEDYFFNPEFIKEKMIGHHWGDDGIWIEEKMTIRITYSETQEGGKKVTIYPTNVLTGIPINPELYAESYQKGVLTDWVVLPAGGNNGITFSNSLASGELYLGLLDLFTSKVPSLLEGSEILNKKTTVPILNEEEKVKVFTPEGSYEETVIIEKIFNPGYVHSIPKINELDFTKLKRYNQVFYECCDRRPLVDLSKISVTNCRDPEEGRISAKVTAFVDLYLMKTVKRLPAELYGLLDKKIDAYTSAFLKSSGISYSNGDSNSGGSDSTSGPIGGGNNGGSESLTEMFNCGVPKDIVMDMYLEGLSYYVPDIPNFFDEANVFIEAREDLFKKFPPKKLTKLFIESGKEVPYFDQNTLKNLLDTLYNSKDLWGVHNIHEHFRINMYKKEGGIVIEFYDEIKIIDYNTGKMAEIPVQKIIDGKLVLSNLDNPLVKSTQIFIKTHSNLERDALYAGMSEETYNNFMRYETDEAFKPGKKVIKKEINGKIVYLIKDTEPSVNIGSIKEHLRKREVCCNAAKRLKTSKTYGWGVTTKNKGLSAYLLRDLNNYTTFGEAYVINSVEEITNDVTKTFYTNTAGKNYSIYRMEDEDLEGFDYTIIDEVTFSGGTKRKMYSKDNKFRVDFETIPLGEVTIKKITIDEPNIDNFDIEIIEPPLENITLPQLMNHLNEYLNGDLDYPKTRSKIFNWKAN